MLLRGRLLSFFLLVFALSVPFWVIGAATGVELLPGLPVAGLMAFCPAIAASILVGDVPGVLRERAG